MKRCKVGMVQGQRQKYIQTIAKHRFFAESPYLQEQETENDTDGDPARVFSWAVRVRQAPKYTEHECT
ncbi:hypothetical protein ACET3Z_001455 [Daucus carota]